jgi:hypothetical protein
MAKCFNCGSETELFDSGTPICVECSNALEGKRTSPISEHQVRSVERNPAPGNASENIKRSANH